MNKRETNRRGVEARRLRYARCREAVSAREAAERYGMEIDRRGRALCPAHDDHHPSVSFRDGRWRCWSCGASGDSIDLTARLLGLTPAQALRRLDRDFGLGLEPDRPPTPEERRKAREWDARQAIRRNFRTWRTIEQTLLCRAIYAGNAAMKLTRHLTDREAAAVYWNAALEYWADQLESGTEAEQRAIYEHREEIERICGKILDGTD